MDFWHLKAGKKPGEARACGMRSTKRNQGQYSLSLGGDTAFEWTKINIKNAASTVAVNRMTNVVVGTCKDIYEQLFSRGMSGDAILFMEGVCMTVCSTDGLWSVVIQKDFTVFSRQEWFGINLYITFIVCI